MTGETIYRLAFLLLFLMLLAMRIYFMVRVRRSGGRILPDEAAIQREGGRGVYMIRIVVFLALMTFLVMYFLGAGWIERFSYPMPPWLRWVGFSVGLLTVAFWTWVQIVLDVQWSAQLQLTGKHHLITTGPYAHIRHPLYTGIFGWCVALCLLTANWIFFGACVLAFLGLSWRIPREEKMMIEAFGEEYKTYMQHAGRLFPKISH
jgi:protein-S-isoprenylcysteine O-methyltransferase Ste14